MRIFIWIDFLIVVFCFQFLKYFNDIFSFSFRLQNNTNPSGIEAFLSAFQSKVFSSLEGEKQLNMDNKCSEENKNDAANANQADVVGKLTPP